MKIKQFMGIIKLASKNGHEWAQCMPAFSIRDGEGHYLTNVGGEDDNEIGIHPILKGPYMGGYTYEDFNRIGYILYQEDYVGDVEELFVPCESLNLAIEAILLEVERLQAEYNPVVSGIPVWCAFERAYSRSYDSSRPGGYHDELDDIRYGHVTGTGRETWDVSRHNELFCIHRPDPLGGHCVLKAGRVLGGDEGNTEVIVVDLGGAEHRHHTYLDNTLRTYYDL